MFGSNPKRAPIKGDGKILQVQRMFRTLQGEGPNVGTPAIFIRLGGCNLACKFCDTEFEQFKKLRLESILLEVERLALNKYGKRSVSLVVITGGEPLRQPLALLCQQLLEAGYEVQIETNGTLFQELHDDVQIVCSPKISNGKYAKIRPDLLQRLNALKFLVSGNIIGYDAVPDVGQSAFDHIEIFVQPMDEYDDKKNQVNYNLAVDIALEKGYKISIQTHKVIGVE